MGDRLQFKAVESQIQKLKSPVLEVGSKIYEGGVSFNFRNLFQSSTNSKVEFVGIDMLPGEGVDRVVNLCDDFDKIDQQLNGVRFNTIICGSVLEHCSNPFKAAENMMKMLASGGVIFVSVPFAFQIHGYPDDYFRFTPNGVKVLFHELDFEQIPGHFCSNDHLPEEIHDLKELPNYWIDFRAAKHKREKKFGLFLEAVLLKIFGFFGLFRSFTKHNYAFPVITLNLFGVKTENK